jgi:hypothetical protein
MITDGKENVGIGYAGVGVSDQGKEMQIGSASIS